MTMTNCPRCKKIALIHPDSLICQPCVTEESDTLDRVRDYLKENPGLTLLQLAKETDVSAKKIEGYIRKGRIELAEPEIQCEKCREKIRQGRFCEDCQEAFTRHSVNSVIKMKEIAQKQKGQAMYTDKGRRKQEKK